MIDHGTKCNGQPCTCRTDAEQAAYRQGYRHGLADRKEVEPAAKPKRKSLQQLHAELPKHSAYCIGCKDCPRDQGCLTKEAKNPSP